MDLTGSWSILFKMHGNRANVLLFEGQRFAEMFRKNIVADSTIQIQKLDRDIDWSFEAFEKNIGNLPALYYTFGKVVWRYLKSTGFDSATTKKKWDMIQTVVAELENPTYRVAMLDNKPILSLVEIGETVTKWKDPIGALNDFYYQRTSVQALIKARNSLLAELRSRLVSSHNYILKNGEKLEEVKGSDRYREWADLLMANLHLIDSHAEKVILENIYHDNRPEEIPMKKDLSPQKNAEIYYRKSKNQQTEIARLQESLANKQAEITTLEKILHDVEHAPDVKSLKAIEVAFRATANQKQEKVSRPYYEFTVDGFEIRVGRSAQHNDILTTKLSHKDDLWLHAKDVAGSHVVIRHQAGKKFPKNVIERAAQLAAYNSKRRNESLCPVIVVPRKFVRKRKGDPAGVVAVEREEVIMVEPRS